MKKIGKSSWKKIIAVLCSVVLCTTAVTWPVGAADIGKDKVQTITIKLPEDDSIDIFGDMQYSLKQETDDYIQLSNKYESKYSKSEHTLTLRPIGGSWIDNAVVIYIEATSSATPVIEKFLGYSAPFSSNPPKVVQSSESFATWQITIPLAVASSDISFEIKAGVVQYNVTYPHNGDDYTIYDERDSDIGGTTQSCEAGKEITFKVGMTETGKNKVPVVLINNKTVSADSVEESTYTYKYIGNCETH